MSGKARKYSTIVALAALIVAGWMIRNQGFRAKNSRASSFHTGRSDLAAGRIGQDSRDFSLYNLLAVPPDELEHIDIALMNLICAQDLKGSEACDIEACLRNLDEWAGQIEEDTKARTKAYYRNPDRYNNSLNMFKVVNMILTLKNEIGVDYNLEIMKKTEFYNSRDFFLHGCLTGKKEGGCISIPTLCVAVGRRLGYPLKLVLTRQHVFFRWDDGKEVFNMEACCPGCDTHPDDYYKKWPFAIKNDEVILNHYLKSLTPAQELALFLQTRGHCLYDSGDVAEAMIMYAYAHKLMPNSLGMLAHVDRAFAHELQRFRRMKANMQDVEAEQTP